MANIEKTPYEILGVPEGTESFELRPVYRTKIHEHKQNKISAINFRRICRAYETLSDNEKSARYTSHKEWISDLPIDKYTPQQLAAEPDLLHHFKKQIQNEHLDKINAQDPVTKHTALYCAARAGNLEAVRLLTERGAGSDSSQRTKSTSLHVASYYEHADVVRYLLESGADYRIVNQYDSTAEEEAHSDEVKQVFAELKQNPYVRVAADELEWFRKNSLAKHIDTEYFAQRQTLLHCACKKGYFNMARFLIEERSANMDLVDFNGNSSLHLAAYGGHRDIVNYLLNRGCDPTYRNRWGTTAQEEGQKHGAGITDLFKSMRGRDMFEMARTGVDWWFYYYFDVKSKDAIDSKGVSLLYYTCRYGHYSVAKWLLEHGANVNIQMTTETKSTPLHGAKYYGQLAIVELLLEYDADINLKNDFGATVYGEGINKEVDKNVALKINELLLQHQFKLKGEKILDIHVYEDHGDGQEPIAKIQLEMKANYKDLLAALSHVKGNQYPYFSVARRGLVFDEKNPSLILAICRAWYTSSKFIDTPICLTRHQIEPKKTGGQQPIHGKTTVDLLREIKRHSKATEFSLKAPIIKKKTVPVGDLRFTFSKGCIDANISFQVLSLFAPNVATFGLSGCLCVFEILPISDGNLIELPIVSLASDPDARLYTLTQPTSYWFTSRTRNTRLPMVGGVHAFMRHIDIIPKKLKLPDDMFVAAALDQPLLERNNPVRCRYLRLRDQNTSKFPLIAYHGTNINAIQSILLDGLVVSGTVVSSGIRINPPKHHFSREETYFGVPDFAAAIFLSPSVHYSSDPVYAVKFDDGDRQLIPVLECSVKRNSYETYECTVEEYTACEGEDINAIEWRIKDPADIEINGILFITMIDSIAAAKAARINKMA